jgi:hypothetical protein
MIERQAATIKLLREAMDSDASMMGERGSEIGKLIGQTEELRLSRALAEQQAATIKTLREQVNYNANVMGEQGREIGRLVALVQQQAANTAAPTSSPDDGRFRNLRALILREMHPDHAPAGSVDGAIRAEVFKTLWPKIEAITGKV